ncbi:GYD domain-containing protein [Actinomycetospora rhizophila]|uniref:GYD domain-containing protein n=1 Tax=Actinomycetospora rhizophila TaxID=1416876 RepID=A0ABV9ZH26_9PSEU
MAKYVTFFSYTDETWAKMIANPSDRRAAVQAAAESLGGNVEAAYFMFGSYDGFVITDLPDSARAAGLSIAVSSTGAIRSLETHEIFASSDLPAVLERAAAVQGAYREPGS